MNDLSFIFLIEIKILNIYIIKKIIIIKRILKYKRSPGAWENLELRLQLQGKHGSGELDLHLQLRIPGLGNGKIQYQNISPFMRKSSMNKNFIFKGIYKNFNAKFSDISHNHEYSTILWHCKVKYICDITHDHFENQETRWHK